tara:strand:+ start:439 stop:1473 length:1035 start_codon:yes stop_codon:yes gene_type:complete
MSDVDQNIELPEIEEASAQKMPVGDEEQSIAATDKAANATNPASKRKGDTANKDEPDGSPKTKAAMINAMYKKMEGMSKQTLSAMATKFEGLEVDMDADAVELPEFNYTDELDALVESEATLSDEFKSKTAIIFETAIKSKLSEEIERLEDDYQSRLEEELDVTRSDLVEKIDSYLNYVVENWMTENKVAVEQGLRTEVAEGFMDKLKDLFVESYVTVPESKVDLVDELADQVEELEESLNSRTAEVLAMSEKIESFQRAAIIREASGDLADTQVEKLASLVEALDFEDVESFQHKVKTVKESYFKKDVTATAVEEVTEDWTAEQPLYNNVMNQYLSAIKNTNK